MAALFRFVDVRCAGSDRLHSFTLHSGETRLLQLSSKVEKDAMIDRAIGETACGEGNIEIVQGETMYSNTANGPPLAEMHDNKVTPMWQPLRGSSPGRVGWVAANGGLISNLKIWENVTLPLWYHGHREVKETEQNIMHWLGVLGLEQAAFAEFMAASPSAVEPWLRKLAGLLRALVQMPQVLVVDAEVFEGVKECLAGSWVKALEAYAAQGYTVLAIADKTTGLPWAGIE